VHVSSIEESLHPHAAEPGSADILHQLERLVASKHFRNSRRYPALLKFVVEHTLAGKTDVLKERNLGTDVFDRASDYDTNADPIVRVTAGEVRKRIAQYYQDPGHEHELRIDLPLGSYVPHFYPAAHAKQYSSAEEHPPAGTSDLVPAAHIGEMIAAKASEATGRSWWQSRSLLLGIVLVLTGATTFYGGSLLLNRMRDAGIRRFWKPVLSSGSPTLIVMGVHSLDKDGHNLPTASYATAVQNQNMLSSMVRSDMVPVSDIVSYSRMTDVLALRSHAYLTVASADTTLEELRHGPVILIGALDNIWTERLAANLRFRFFGATLSQGGIQDSQHPSSTWTFDNTQPALANSRDYAIVASYFDRTIEQHVLIVAGVGKAGTEAAAEFLSSNHDLDDWVKASRLPQNKNVEIVLSTDILDGQPGPPHVLAYSYW
jgi:hypothetical protein